MKTENHRQALLRTLYQEAMGVSRKPTDNELDWRRDKVRELEEADLKEMFTRPASDHPAQPTGNPRLDRILRNAGVAMLYGFSPANSAVQFDALSEHMKAQVKTRDFISFPNADGFPDMAAYRRTLAHELIHWTGTEGRSHRRGTDSGMNWLHEILGIPPDGYAQEEMTAEFGAVLLLDEVAPDDASIAHSALYAGDWANSLSDDKRAKAYTAAMRDAIKAVDWLLQFDHD